MRSRAAGRSASLLHHLAHQDLVASARVRRTEALERVPLGELRVPMRDHLVALDLRDAVPIIVGQHRPYRDLAELASVLLALVPVREEAGRQRAPAELPL